MTKTVHPVLKKTGAVLLTVLVLVLVAVPAFAVALPDAPTGYVYDGANVLSSSTESYIERTGSALAEACGAEVVVATVDFTDGEDIADYAYDLFNKWGIGDKKSNNGLLILLSIGAEDYYAEPGVGLTDVFTGGVLDAMLYDYLEDDFAAKEYDSGVKKVYARAVPDSAARDQVDLAARVPRAVPVPVADAPAVLAAAVRAAVRRAQAEAPRMAEVQAEEDEYLGFV